MTDSKVVPLEPERERLISMAVRLDHGFGLLERDEQESMIRQMRQVYEEAIGVGFYAPETADRYTAMLVAAPQAVSTDARNKGYSMTPKPATALTREQIEQRKFFSSDPQERELCDLALQAISSAGQELTREQEAVRDVIAERQRQVEREGWTPSHDDEHCDDELAIAGAVYALPERHRTIAVNTDAPALWPWDSDWYKPKDRRRDLIRAAALIIAEIDRLDRLAAHREKP